MQTDYDYEIAKAQRKKERAWQKQDFEIVTEIWSDTTPWDNSDVDKVSSNDIVPQNENVWLPWDNIKESWNDEENTPIIETQWQSVLQPEVEDSIQPQISDEEKRQRRYELKKIFMNF